MATLLNAATITTVVGTEVSALGLNPGTSPGSYVYKLDVNALAAGEVLFIREYNIISLTAANLLSAAASSFEDGTVGGWANAGNCNLTNVGTQGLDGSHALQMSSVAAGNMFIDSATATTAMLPVSPGVTYGGVIFFKAGSTGRSCQAVFQWFNAVGALVRQDSGAAQADTSGAWQGAMVAGVAPTGAAFVLLQAVVQSTAGAAELHFVDCCEVGPILGVNLMTATQSSFEAGVTGWSANTNCSISSVTTAALDGSHSLQMSSTAGGAMNAVSSSGGIGTPVVPGRTYTAVASFQAAAATPQSVRVDIQWENISGSILGTTTGTAAADTNGVMTQVTASAAAPAGAVSASLILSVLNTGGAAELHFVDCVGILDGATTAWIIGGTQSGGWSIGGVERLNYFGSYIAGADADPLVETVPILVDVNSRLTLQQKNGSARAIPVKVLKL